MGSTMGMMALGITVESNSVPARGERVAAYVEDYMKFHPGLSLGELAFRLKADKRDLRRLLNDRSCGWRLEDALAGYFGDDFVEAVFRPVVGNRREKELERERAEIAARSERLQRDRAERRARDAEGGRADRHRDNGELQARF